MTTTMEDLCHYDTRTTIMGFDIAISWWGSVTEGMEDLLDQAAREHIVEMLSHDRTCTGGSLVYYDDRGSDFTGEWEVENE